MRSSCVAPVLLAAGQRPELRVDDVAVAVEVAGRGVVEQAVAVVVGL
jgi:hypothetical protein